MTAARVRPESIKAVRKRKLRMITNDEWDALMEKFSASWKGDRGFLHQRRSHVEQVNKILDGPKP